MFLLVVPLGAAALYVVAASSHAAPDLRPDVPPEFVAYRVLQRQADAFPQSILTLLDNGGWVAYATALLASLLVGAEFSWATIRTTYLASGHLAGFLVVRLTSLALLACLVLVALALLGAVLPVVASPFIEFPMGPSIDIAGTFAYGGAWLLTAFLFGAIGTFCSILTRSSAAGLVMTIVYVYAENFVVLRPELSPAGYPQGLALLLPVQSTTALVRAAAGVAGRVDPISAMPGAVPFAATGGSPLIPALWIIAILVASFAILARRDIAE